VDEESLDSLVTRLDEMGQTMEKFESWSDEPSTWEGDASVIILTSTEWRGEAGGTLATGMTALAFRVRRNVSQTSPRSRDARASGAWRAVFVWPGATHP
jgi:hypothetical protein